MAVCKSKNAELGRAKKETEALQEFTNKLLQEKQARAAEEDRSRAAKPLAAEAPSPSSAKRAPTREERESAKLKEVVRRFKLLQACGAGGRGGTGAGEGQRGGGRQ